MSKKRRKSRRKKRKLQIAVSFAVILIVLAVCLTMQAYRNYTEHNEQAAQEETETLTAQALDTAEKEDLPVPDEPAVESTATIGVTGDIMGHSPLFKAALTSDGTYDFTSMFEAISPYWESVDYMIANLEVTLGGTDAGAYSGYPLFNCPDSIAEALAGAGVDMLLTANNHAYDTGENGLLRTQAVIEEYGLDHTGTRTDAEDSYVLIKEINGITFGFTCYTYSTYDDDGTKSLNGIEMTETAAGLVNSFAYSDLDSFYETVSEEFAEMDEAECDVKMVFIHWGEEYQDEPNEYQTEIAQALSDLGADVIIGGHPHVIQAFDVLEGEDGNTTYCLYSAGNALSNQRASFMVSDGYRGYTEDGLTFQITFEKLNNGTVRLSEIYILPTWVERSGSDFSIVPLDYTLDTSLWETSDTSSAIASYNRTLERLGEVYPSLRSELGLDEVPDSVE